MTVVAKPPIVKVASVVVLMIETPVVKSDCDEE